MNSLTQFEGKYDVIEVLHEGGMGKILRVQHRNLQVPRVIKIMRRQLAEDAQFQSRFLQEARLAAGLKHPNIAQIHDFSVDNSGTGYIVMEYIDGVSLKEVLAANGPPGLAVSLEIARQGLRALGFLHRKGYVHRDISPDNILVTSDVDHQLSVKIIDLGIAKKLGGSDGLTTTGHFLGKLRYSSPEHFGEKGAAGADTRSDVYSFGLVLYELLTGQQAILGNDLPSLSAGHLHRPPVPFESSDLRGQVPEALRSIVLRSLEKGPPSRFHDGDTFGTILGDIQSQFPLTSSFDLAALLEPARQFRRRKRAQAGDSTQRHLAQQFGVETTPGGRSWSSSRPGTDVSRTRSTGTEIRLGPEITGSGSVDDDTGAYRTVQGEDAAGRTQRITHLGPLADPSRPESLQGSQGYSDLPAEDFQGPAPSEKTQRLDLSALSVAPPDQAVAPGSAAGGSLPHPLGTTGSQPSVRLPSEAPFETAPAGVRLPELDDLQETTAPLPQIDNLMLPEASARPSSADPSPRPPAERPSAPPSTKASAPEIDASVGEPPLMPSPRLSPPVPPTDPSRNSPSASPESLLERPLPAVSLPPPMDASDPGMPPPPPPGAPPGLDAMSLQPAAPSSDHRPPDRPPTSKPPLTPGQNPTAPAAGSQGDPVRSRKDAAANPPVAALLKRHRWLLLGGLGGLALVVLVAALFLGGEKPQAPPDVVETPPVALPPPVVAPPAVEVTLHPELESARSCLDLGDMECVLQSLTLLDGVYLTQAEQDAKGVIEAEIAAIEAEAAASEPEADVAGLGATVVQALAKGPVGDLKDAVDAIGKLQRQDGEILTAFDEATRQAIDEGEKVIIVYRRMWGHKNSDKHLDVVRVARELIEIYPPYASRASAHREDAAQAIEVASKELEASGDPQAAAALLQDLATAWPDRTGVAGEISRLQKLYEADRAMEARLAQIEKVIENRQLEEGHAQLLVVRQELPADSPYQGRVEKLSQRVQELLTILDQRPPVVSLAWSRELQYKPKEPCTVELVVTDDYEVMDVLGFARYGEDGSFLPAAVKGQGKDRYLLELDPQSHGNPKRIEFYVEARDRSGNKGSLGSAQSPQEITRKSRFRRARGIF